MYFNVKFVSFFLTEVDMSNDCHQVNSLHETKFTARHLRFTIKSGYDHVCAVYRVEVKGHQNKSKENEIVHEADVPGTD
jgi:hypothetical protein